MNAGLRLFDRVEGHAARHSRAVSVFSALVFVFGCASAAGFVRLPEVDWLQWLEGWPAIALAAVWNALWWGFGYPRVQARKAARAAAQQP